MIMKPYKGRKVDPARDVRVYRNLAKGRSFMYSVVQDGKVVAHTVDLVLKDVHFTVREGGRRRVIREGRKNVHAFVVGRITNRKPSSRPLRGHYNPYEGPHFVVRDDELAPWRPVKLADHVHLSGAGLLVFNPR